MSAGREKKLYDKAGQKKKKVSGSSKKKQGEDGGMGPNVKVGSDFV